MLRGFCCNGSTTVDDDDDTGVIYQLHAFAWQVKMDRLEGCNARLGYHLAAALKDDRLSDDCAAVYVDILADAFERGGYPRWD